MTCNTMANPKGPCPNVSFDASINRVYHIGSFRAGHDLPGNQLNDIWSTYEYDAEGRVKHSYLTGPWQYPMYNALGQRVQEYQGTDTMTLTYQVDITGRRVAAWDQRPSIHTTCWWHRSHLLSRDAKTEG